MLLFDQLKRDDPPLRAVAIMVLGGLLILVAGLWWVQVVSTGDYQAHLETQSYRTVRMPAVRGRILDRNGIVLAENRPAYNISLYLEELSKHFDKAGGVEISNARTELKQRMAAEETRLGRKLTKEEKKQFSLNSADKERLRMKARYETASNVVWQVSNRLQRPMWLEATNFERHYTSRLALPLPVLKNLNATNIARFEEQRVSMPGADLEIQSTRVYPYHTAAAHMLGSLLRDDRSVEGEESFFSYWLPDFRGLAGIEAGYDKELRGVAGSKSVLVNNVGYRQTEHVWTPAEPGENVALTIDLHIQRKAERALQIYGPNTRGALVVMDVNTGDVLAIASSPTLDPNDSIQGLPPGEADRRNDPKLRPQINRATFENYAPGSIFKIIVGLACLESGLDPKKVIYNPGHIMVGNHPVKDLAPQGEYDFKLALMHSSNTYFISNGLHAGIESIIRLGERLHLGERIGLHTRQETAGIFPDMRRVSSHWYEGDTANLCIGQGKMAVTPLQMAVMTAAIANGGRVLWPRVVARTEPQDFAPLGITNYFETGRVRDNLGVKPQNLQIVKDAMLADVEEHGGTGVKAAIPGFRICGKTGTAQVMDAHNHTIADTAWFASFAPYEKPRYAVVVMVEADVNAGSGGGTCAPIAHDIYQAILARENMGSGRERLARAE